MPMARLALRDHCTIEDVERRKQRRGAVAKVVVSDAFDVAQPHRQHRLGALQRLDLALLVHAQHQGLVGRIEVEAHHVAHFLHEERVGGELEALGCGGAAARRARSSAPTVLLEMPVSAATRAHAPVRGGGWVCYAAPG